MLYTIIKTSLQLLTQCFFNTEQRSEVVKSRILPPLLFNTDRYIRFKYRFLLKLEKLQAVCENPLSFFPIRQPF